MIQWSLPLPSVASANLFLPLAKMSPNSGAHSLPMVIPLDKPCMELAKKYQPRAARQRGICFELPYEFHLI